MKNIILAVLWITLFGNIVIRFIQMIVKIRRSTYSTTTIHRFFCMTCHQENLYHGNELKQNLKKSRDQTKINGKTTTYYNVYCHSCENYSKQKKVFDTNIHERFMSQIVSYNLDYKADNYAKPYIKEFLLKGLLPAPFILLLFGLVAAFL